MKFAYRVGKESLIYKGISFHIEKPSYSLSDWMNRNGLQETETVETRDGEKFTIWANYARHLACAIPV